MLRCSCWLQRVTEKISNQNPASFACPACPDCSALFLCKSPTKPWQSDTWRELCAELSQQTSLTVLRQFWQLQTSKMNPRQDTIFQFHLLFFSGLRCSIGSIHLPKNIHITEKMTASPSVKPSSKKCRNIAAMLLKFWPIRTCHWCLVLEVDFARFGRSIWNILGPGGPCRQRLPKAWHAGAATSWNILPCKHSQLGNQPNRWNIKSNFSPHENEDKTWNLNDKVGGYNNYAFLNI